MFFFQDFVWKTKPGGLELQLFSKKLVKDYKECTKFCKGSMCTYWNLEKATKMCYTLSTVEEETQDAGNISGFNNNNC